MNEELGSLSLMDLNEEWSISYARENRDRITYPLRFSDEENEIKLEARAKLAEYVQNFNCEQDNEYKSEDDEYLTVISTVWLEFLEEPDLKIVNKKQKYEQLAFLLLPTFHHIAYRQLVNDGLIKVNTHVDNEANKDEDIIQINHRYDPIFWPFSYGRKILEIISSTLQRRWDTDILVSSSLLKVYLQFLEIAIGTSSNDDQFYLDNERRKWAIKHIVKPIVQWILSSRVYISCLAIGDR